MAQTHHTEGNSAIQLALSHQCVVCLIQRTTTQSPLIRLENICAVSVVKNGRNNKTLTQVPAHLHKVLWKAYLLHKYYTNNFNFGKYQNSYIIGHMKNSFSKT